MRKIIRNRGVGLIVIELGNHMGVRPKVKMEGLSMR